MTVPGKGCGPSSAPVRAELLPPRPRILQALASPSWGLRPRPPRGPRFGVLRLPLPPGGPGRARVPRRPRPSSPAGTNRALTAALTARERPEAEAGRARPRRRTHAQTRGGGRPGSARRDPAHRRYRCRGTCLFLSALALVVEAAGGPRGVGCSLGGGRGRGRAGPGAGAGALRGQGCGRAGRGRAGPGGARTPTSRPRGGSAGALQHAERRWRVRGPVRAAEMVSALAPCRPLRRGRCPAAPLAHCATRSPQLRQQPHHWCQGPRVHPDKRGRGELGFARPVPWGTPVRDVVLGLALCIAFQTPGEWHFHVLTGGQGHRQV